MRTTRYTDVVLSHVPYRKHPGDLKVVRTRTGKGLMKVIGECIAARGSVQMTTRYEGDCEIADAVLHWGPVIKPSSMGSI